MPTSSPRVLIADDQRDVLEALRLLLKSEGMESQAVTSPAALLAALEKGDYDAALIDLNYTRDTTSGKEGLDLLARIRDLDDSLPVVVMTAWGTVDVAVEAMRRGARDFVQKPWDNTRLLATLRTQIALGRALKRGERLEAENRILRAEPDASLIAQSAAMRPVLEMIARVAPSDANVFIVGENGSGKGMVARALHAGSRRASRPLVTLNAGGISEGVFESELFGHVKGAFTDARADRVGRFELADGGTLFLDEIANVPAGQQAKLLRVLETGEFERLGSSRTRKVDVRILSASNADLHAEVAAGRFRQDLYHRLAAVVLELPRLRARGRDVLNLANHFIARVASEHGVPRKTLAADACQVLLSYAWPGNVRELANVLERGMLLEDGP
ncbi:MAG TPA: sigma-54 dependent transcriptional regulator, partial [Thermoanaerobaculia bacterium]|nr:sigma-54 dependent transcriptional regulator [Thermoanaerobaculia bacterium]